MVRMKKKKAAGEYHIPNEVWMYSTSKIREKAIELIKKVWKGEGIPKN